MLPRNYKRAAAMLLAAVLHLTASGSEVTKLALVSLIGDALTVVVYQPSVGSSIDQNRRQVLPLADSTFDKATTKAAADSIQRFPWSTSPALTVISVAASQDKSVVDAGRFVPSPILQSALTESGATHLLLFTKHRAASFLKTANGAVGSGYLEGLGFYIDRVKRMLRSDTGETGTGFLAPFAYFRVSLIDLGSFEVIREEAVSASTTLSAARTKDGFDPWDALNAEEKIGILQKLIRTEVSRVVPIVLIPK